MPKQNKTFEEKVQLIMEAERLSEDSEFVSEVMEKVGKIANERNVGVVGMAKDLGISLNSYYLIKRGAKPTLAMLCRLVKEF